MRRQEILHKAIHLFAFAVSTASNVLNFSSDLRFDVNHNSDRDCSSQTYCKHCNVYNGTHNCRKQSFFSVGPGRFFASTVSLWTAIRGLKLPNAYWLCDITVTYTLRVYQTAKI